MKQSLPTTGLLFIAILLFSFTNSESQCDCDFFVSSNASDITFDAAAKGVKPGDKICLPNGTRTGIVFKNITGTPDKPVLITNRCDGKSTILAPANWGNTFEFVKCSNYRLSGSGNPAEFYGIDISGAQYGVQNHDFSTDFELDHLVIHDVSSTGLAAKTPPTCSPTTWRGNFTMRNLIIHDLKIYNTVTEAMYIGNSHHDIGVTLTCSSVPTFILEHDVDNVIVYNCLLENIGNDGIQIGAATNTVVHHNVVLGTGIKNNESHMNGIQIGSGCTNALVYNNIVDGAHGSGIFDSGGGGLYYNNIVTNSIQSGVFIKDDAPNFAPRGFLLINNTLINNNNNSIYMLSENVNPSKFENNIIVSPAAGKHIYINNSNVKWSEANNLKTFDINTVKFVDPSTKDYHLKTGSAAIDGGKDESTYGVTFDLNENPRPNGASFDIGAYEFQTGAPTSSAGADKSITLPTNSIILNGSGTSVTGITGYLWTQKSGGASTLTNETTANLTAAGLVAGTYVFELRVTDASGVAFDQATVTVLPAAVNQNPTANAGGNKSITLPTNSITLNGIGTDPDGSITSYAWIKVAGGAVSMAGNATPNLALTGMVAGPYTFQLTVTDDKSATATSQAIVTVNPAAVNQLPLVNAGTDKSIYTPVNQVTITGTASDPDGSISSILWEKKSGAAASLANPNTLSMTASGLTLGNYNFRLTVTDNKGGVSYDEVTVFVLQGNQSPVANAGANVPLTLPTDFITLTGTGTDPDGSIASYLWVKVSGPTATLAGTATNTLSVTNMLQGAYVFGLTVTDNNGATGYDEVTVAVSVAPTGPNEMPLSIAGGNISFSLPTNSSNLYGAGFDPDGTITTYSWTKASGGTATLTNADKPTLTVSNLVAGQYRFRLTVTDDKGATDDDDAIVTVSNLGTNIFPVANAGADQIVRLPQNSVQLNGSASDTDGTIITSTWSQVSGGSATISSVSTASTNISNLSEGIYSFRLTVVDDDGASDLNDVTVRVVSSTNNLPPVVDAGLDATIFLPQNTVTMNATALDDGVITAYHWVKLSGPTASLLNPTELNLSVENMVVGNYTFQLTVTDNNAASVFDIVKVSVLPADFSPPVVNAGEDELISLPVNQITLTGTATVDNGTIASTIWTKTLGPNATLSGENTLTMQATGLIEGTYVFTLSVTDSNGKNTSDNVQVVVQPVQPNQAPLVTAGPNVVVSPPDTQAILTGTAIDTDGTVASLAWTQVSGPSTATLQNQTTLTVTASALVPGAYIFKLSATDNLGLTGSGNAIVVVPDPNQLNNNPPVAFAGADTVLIKPDLNMIIMGSAFDSDGEILASSWEQISGNSIVFTVNESMLEVNDPPLGTYGFKFTTMDDDSVSSSDDMLLSVIERTQEIPKFFSPNNDGQGEFWAFRNIEAYQQCKLSVISRSGHLVYEASPYNNNWDGTYNGRPLSDGDYYYNISCDDGKKITGAVRIIR